jgi:hypothetical protein
VKPLSFLVLVTMSLLGGNSLAQTSGVRPRPDANSYPAKGRVPTATFAAAVLSPAQIKASFGTDTYKGYIVLEVAVFPDDPREALKLSPQDFTLQIGGLFLRPSAPATVALSIEEKNNPFHAPKVRSPVDVVTTSTIGYDSGGAYNPNTGKRQGTVYTATQVDVAPAGTLAHGPAPHKGRNFDDMEGELSAKALPETAVSRPVAGYLYFIPPRKKATGIYDLQYAGDSGQTQLSVPPPSR